MIVQSKFCQCLQRSDQTTNRETF